MNRKTMTNINMFDETITGVCLEDRISVPSKRTLTDAGQMIVPCKFARTGSQLYTAGQLGLEGVDSKKVITVYRDEADVFDEKSVDTFRSSPVTVGHPRNEEGKLIQLTAENAKSLQVGMLEGMPTRDEDTLGGNLVLTAKEAIDSLEEGTQELSAGYTCDIEEVDGKFYQRNIRANHIAIVAKGRAGSSCRISDEAEVHVFDELVAAQEELAKEKKALVSLGDELKVQTELVDELKATSESQVVEFTKLKAALADAQVAAEEGVIERCEVIENARLIADMRDLGSKPVIDIKRMVILDQMPERDLSGKSDAFIDAMFEILVDSSKGETPMGKIFKQQESHVVVDAKPVDPVAASRQKMIDRNKSAAK